MSADNWYIARDKKKFGPYATAQMKQMASGGQLLRTDMVLEEGKTAWLPASAVQGFFPASGLAPPPALPPVPASAASSALQATGTEQVPQSAGSFSKLWGVVRRLWEVKGQISEAYGYLLTVIGVLPFIGGMAGDFLRPIAPFNFLIFLIGLVTTGGLVFLFIKRPNALSFPLGATCVFSVLMTVGFGAWWVLAAVAGGNEKGVLANNIAVVGKLQSTVIRGDSVVTEQKIEGDKVAEKVLKEIETEKDAQKLLRFAFEGYPGNVIKAEVIGTPKRKPGKGEEIILECNLEISVDMEQYDVIVKTKLLPVLEKVALRKGEYFQNGVGKRPTFAFARNLRIDGKDSDDFQSTGELMQLQGDFRKKTLNLDKTSERILTVNSARNGSDDQTTWKWYHVPKEDVFNWKSGRTRVGVAIIFYDKGMGEISRDQVVIEGAAIPGLVLERGNYEGATISPYFLHNDFYTRNFTVKREIRFVASELQKMNTIRCSVKNME